MGLLGPGRVLAPFTWEMYDQCCGNQSGPGFECTCDPGCTCPCAHCACSPDGDNGDRNDHRQEIPAQQGKPPKTRKNSSAYLTFPDSAGREKP
jgi:hypothetical protein